MALHSWVERYCSSVLSTRNTFSTLELNSEAGTSPWVLLNSTKKTNPPPTSAMSSRLSRSHASILE